MNKPARINPGKRPELKWLPVDRLSVDHRYQRTLESRRSQLLVEQIAANFKRLAFQAVLATPNGKKGGARGWLVIDGQHRVEAARRAGIREVPAVVVDAATLQDQAAAFVRANTDRVSVSPFALHRARVSGGDPKAVALEALCRKTGIEIPPYQIPADKLKPGQTIALATVARLQPNYGDAVAEATLRTVAKAYEGVSGALRAPVIQAVAALLKEAGPNLTIIAGRIAEHLAKTDATRFALQALESKKRNGGTEAHACIRLIKSAIERVQPMAPVSGDGFIKPLTRQQLMGRR